MKLVQITNASERDVAISLWFQIFTDEPYWVKKYVINMVYDPRNRRNKPGQPYFVIYHYGKPVGVTGIYKDKKKGTYWLGWFGILPEYQGTGIGSKALEATIKELKKIRPNLDYFYLWTEGGLAIQSFYRKNGFNYFGKLIDWKTNAKIYRKNIQNT